MSWGKHHTSMYEGSMIGKGALFFAVWGYVISHQRPSRKLEAMMVELNADLLGLLLGEDAKDVQKVLDEMQRPDPKSRSRAEEGRKLVRVAPYLYRVVNGEYYRAMRNEEDRREYQRVMQARYRRRKKGKPLPGEEAFVRKANEEGLGAADKEMDEANHRHDEAETG